MSYKINTTINIQQKYKIQNKINIVVTGSTSGIGRATVKALAQSDKAYNIFVTSRKQANAEAAIEKLAQEIGDSASTLKALEIDLASQESVDAFVANLVAQDIQLDVLLNNAGVHGMEEAKKTQEGFDRVFNVNFRHTRYLSEQILEQGRIKENGKIIVVASSAVSSRSSRTSIRISSRGFRRGRAGATRSSTLSRRSGLLTTRTQKEPSFGLLGSTSPAR